ncbi:MAG: DUF6541 family protein [Candidatus Bathyarchaeales archaeon]
MLMLLPTFQMLLLLFLFAVLGEPIRFFLIKRLRTFSSADFIQVFTLDVYLGGMVIYLLATLPFHLFSYIIVLGLTLFCLFLSLFVHFGFLRQNLNLNVIKSAFSRSNTKVIDYALVFSMFLFLLLFNIGSLSELTFGPMFDESTHALKVQVILENGQIPLTLQPYLPEGIIYPAASHVLFAYAVQILNLSVPSSVFYVTLLFKAFSVFGAYFLGKEIDSGREFALSLCFVFTFVSSWPLYIVWGSNPFIMGFPLFLVNLGLLFRLASMEKNSLGELVVVGLLFGYNGSLIVSYIQTLTLMAFIIFVYWLIRRKTLRHRKLREFLLITASAVIVLSPIFYRFFAFYPYPGHNIGLPEDFQGYQVTRLPFTAAQALEWAFENLSPYFMLRCLMLSMLVGLVFLLWKTKGYVGVKAIIGFSLTLSFSCALLSFFSYLLPSDLEVISWSHQGILIIISINILLALLYVKLKKAFNNITSKRIYAFLGKSFSRSILIVWLILLLLNIPFFYYRLFRDPQVLLGTYQMFSITTDNDYKLMVWIKENTPSNAVILISPYESGSFIPVVSNRKIVFPYTATRFSSSYQNLVEMTLNNVLNQTAYEYMQKLGVTHVFVGENAAYWWFEQRKWNPLLFLGNPNFRLVKNFGRAYLFEFNYSTTNIAFFDNFAHERWNELGWQVYVYGNGVGNAAISNISKPESEALKITAQAFYSISEIKYVYSVMREIFVQNNSKVSFSFYLNATEGFNGKDTFAFIISNVFRNQSIVITTPNGVYENYNHSISLAGREGFFEFSGNISLSALWYQWYNSTFPSAFILEMVNYDLDGVQNVAYVDDIKITLTS